MTDRQLAAAVRNSDRGAFTILADRHARLLRLMVRDYQLAPGLTVDDLHQAALLGLWDACVFIAPDSNGVFTAFLRPCVRHRILYALRTARAQKHRPVSDATSFDAPVGVPPRRAGRGRTLDEVLPCAQTTAEIAENRENLRTLARELPPQLSPGQRRALARRLNGTPAPTPREQNTDAVQMTRVRRKARLVLGEAA